MSGNDVIRRMALDILQKESSLTEVVTCLSPAEFSDGYLRHTYTLRLYRFLEDCSDIPQ